MITASATMLMFMKGALRCHVLLPPQDATSSFANHRSTTSLFTGARLRRWIQFRARLAGLWSRRWLAFAR